MSILEDHRRSRRSATTAIHEHRLVTARDGALHLFVEGDADGSFYLAFVMARFPEATPYLYRCGGKREVLDVRNRIQNERLPPCKRLFCVDRDLDPLLGAPSPPPDVFVTDHYSIENYVVTATMFARIWIEFFRLGPHGLEEATETFKRVHGAFHKRMLPVMAWILCARRRGLKCNLNNIPLHELLKFGNATTISRSSGALRLLERSTSVPVRIPLTELLKAARELRLCPPKSYVRGKFEAWFLLSLIRRIQTTGWAGGGQGRCSVSFSESNLVDILAPRAPCPASFADYLERMAAQSPAA